MIKALITGGAGFIGFHLAKYLASQGKEVTITDNLFRGKKDEELNTFLQQKNVKCIEADLTDVAQLKKLGKGYDEVYHLAAINGTELFYSIPHEVLRVNVLAALNILEWFKDQGKGKILFSSSSETYAGTMRAFGIPVPTPEEVPLAIDDVYNARWSYGGSKIVGELLFINYARKFGFPMSIIRYHNIYGPRMGHEHVIPQFCKRLFAGENPFVIKGGKPTRAFCYVDDGVKATVAVMESKKTNMQTVHIGNSSEEIAIDGLAKLMFKIAGRAPKLDLHPEPEGSVMRRCPDTKKLKELTGFESSVSLSEGLKPTMDWYKRVYDQRN